MSNVMKSAAASQTIAKMYLNEELADVHFKFEVDGETKMVPASKGVLAALSPVFHTMFFGSLKEGNEVKIEDADVDAFKEFLQIFYLSEVTLSMENIEAVVRLADKYDVLEHVNACAAFLKNQLTPNNICWGYQLAVNLKNEELIKFCENEIIVSAKNVFASEVFVNCEKSTLKRILELDLSCAETDVFDACLTWAKHACEQDNLDATQAANLRIQLGDCLKLIRFGLMESEEFCECYIPNKGLFTSQEFEDIMLSLSAKKYETKIFNQMPRRQKWDAANILICRRKTQSPGPKKMIKSLEVTSFSSNNRLLLGEISTTYTHKGSSSIVGIEVDVTITEREDLEFQSTASLKVIYEGTSKTWDGEDGKQLKVTLPWPILIKPQRMYEVCLVVRSPNECFYGSDCQPMVEMDDGTRIQFHRNPTLSYDNLANGWIAELVFNKF